MNKMICAIMLSTILMLSVRSEHFTGNNLPATSALENGASNSNTQPELSAYYHTMQSLPYHGASTNLRKQSGYNYLTPASTYAGYSTTMHATRTPPLALSLHPDDYAKFDKTEETYFLSSVKSLAPTANAKAQPNFYVPRTSATNRKKIQTQQTEAATTFDSEKLNNIPSENPQAFIEDAQYQSVSNARFLPQGTQQNWQPLTQQQQLTKQTPIIVNTPAQSSQAITDFYQLNRGGGSNLNENLTSLQEDPTTSCQKHTMNLQIDEFRLRSPKPSTQIQDSAQVSRFPQQQQQTKLAADSPNFAPPTESARSFPASSSVNALNHLRLNIIKSLLAEYFALTQSRVPIVPGSLNNDETAENVVDNRFVLEAQPVQAPSYSPAVKKFINAQHQPQQYYQSQPTIPNIRQPHSVYGAPFGDSVNAGSEQRNGEIS